MRRSLVSTLIISAAAGCVLLPGIGAAPLWEEDEPKNAACSLAMLDSGDWIVPTFNGELRVEKPPLVNWIQLAGISLLGRNEAGVRIGSVVLTVGTCLLSGWLGRLLAGPSVGLLTGLIMASCVWTAIGGRAATPDAPLVFCTTLAATIFAHGLRHRPTEPLSLGHATGIGLACGLAILAKGPVGLVLPLVSFAACRWCLDRGDSAGWLARIGTASAATRLLLSGGVALAVALPWYLLVSIKTGGRWLEEFFFVHNVGRFAAPMEGHDGSLAYYPLVLAVGLFPWSLVILAVPLHAVFLWKTTPTTSERRLPLAFAGCWAAAWVGAFSLAGTKLPGYVWPAYPGLALLTAMYLADWLDGQTGWEKSLWRRLSPAAVMHVGLGSVALVGGGFVVGLPLVARRFAPGQEWLGLIGLVPIAAAGLAAVAERYGQRRRCLAILASSAVLLLALLGGVAAVRLARHQGTASLLAAVPPSSRPGCWAGLHPISPSLVFYTGAEVRSLPDAAACRDHLLTDPAARLVIRAARLGEILPQLPSDCRLLSLKPPSFDPALAIIGRTGRPPAGTLAQQPPAPSQVPLERF